MIMGKPIAFTAAMLMLAISAASLPDHAAAEQITVGQTFVASGIDPAQGSTGWALVTHGIAEQLFRVSREGKIVPNLASSATLNEDGSWIVELAPERFFSDGTPVTADAVATALNRTSEANPSARATAGRLTFGATDKDTLTVTSEQPTTILPSILAEWAFPIYRETDKGMIFTGPYMVKKFEAGATIEMVPNPHYDGAQSRPDLIIRKIGEGQALALAFAAGEVDLAFNLPVETLSMFDGKEDRTVKSIPVAYQYMMWMNTRRPSLSDVRLRRAIDMAISREDLVSAARAGVPATGAFSQTYPFAAEGEIPQDSAAAKALLDEAGWKVGEDGVRVKNGERLELVLLAYPQRPDLVTFQPVIRAALAELGIVVTTRITDTPSETASKGEFDLLLWAQHTAPAGDPGLFLSLFFETGAAQNYTGWSNSDYDALINELKKTGEQKQRIELAKRAQKIIASESPVSFLVTPEWHVGLSGKLTDYEPWGSDYYVIRPDLKVK